MSHANGTTTPPKPNPTLLLLDCIERLKRARIALQAIRMERACAEYPSGNAERPSALEARCKAFDQAHGSPEGYLQGWQAGLGKT